jgi:hypothetical protein
MFISKMSRARRSAAKLLTKDETRPTLEVRPHDENDNSRAQRQQQHKAEIVFCSVHLNETSGATARARCSRSSLPIMSFSAELILKCWPAAAATLP